MRIRRIAAATGALAVAVALTVSGPAAFAAVSGDVSVVVEDADGNPMAGVELTLSSTNCTVASPTATTDAAGTATFAGLSYYTDETEATPCDYDLVQTVPDGYEQVTATAALLGLQAGELLTAPSTVQVDSADGVFSAVSRNDTAEIQCLEGVGTSTVLAGRNALYGDSSNPDCDPAVNGPGDFGYEKSGLQYDAPAAPVALPEGVTRIATLWHINRNVQRPLHYATLSVDIQVTNTETGDTVTVPRQFQFSIDETDNLDEVHGSDVFAAIEDYDPAECYYPYVSDLGVAVPNGGIQIANPLYPITQPEFYEFGCADLLEVEEVGDPGFERVGTAMVDFSLDLALAGDQGECADPASPSFTQEETNTEICLLLGVEIEPATDVLTVSIVNELIEDDVTEPEEPEDEELAATGASDHLGLISVGGAFLLLAGGMLAAARRRS